MNENSLSSQQLAFLLFMTLLGGSYIHVTPTLAHQSAWLSALTGSLAGIYLLLALLHLQTLYPHTSFSAISEKLLGKIAGKLVGLLFLWAVFIMGISLLQDDCLILVVMFPLYSCLFLRAVLISPAMYTIYKGVSSIGRLGELFAWLTLVLTILAFIVSLPLVQLDFLSPLDSLANIARGTLQSAGWPFSLVGLLAFFLPVVNDLAEKKKVIYWWYLLAVLILVLKDVLSTTVLSPDILVNSRYPLLEVLRLDIFGGFQRVELFFFLAWFMISFYAMLTTYQCLVLGGQALFSLDNYGVLVIPTGLLLLVFSLYSFESDIDFKALQVLTLPLHNLILMIGLPTLLLAAAKIRKITAASRPRNTGLQ